jgi:butyrate kinase
VDVTDLRAAFPNAAPEITSSLDKIRFSARYRKFDVSLAELDKLAQVPDLTEAQKKAVNDAIEKVKAAISAMPAQPAQ